MSDSLVTAPKKRIGLIDGVRGVMILYVVFYHLLYDLYLYRLVSWSLLDSPPIRITHFICYSTLVFFSGISCNLSRNNLKRGAVLFGEGMVITGVTWVMDHTYYVRFGVLHFLGLSAVLWWLLKRYLIKEKHLERWFLFLMLVLYGVTYKLLYMKSVTFSGFGWLGFPGPGYYSTDYFPLIPFSFLYSAGIWAGSRIAARKAPGWFYNIDLPGFAWLGKHSIWIYLIHQPLLYGLVWLIAR